MKHKKVLSVLCIASLMLCACGSTGNKETTAAPSNAQPAVEESSAVEIEAESTGKSEDETAGDADSTEAAVTDSGAGTAADSGAETTAPEKKVSLSIPGYDASNIPRLDGSLANEPLLIRMMTELTGCDQDTAETYLADSFENGGTSTSWSKLLYDSMDLIISYEPPQEVKDSYSEEFNQLEIDPIGRDGLVFIVNVNNPIESLTLDQIRGIYTSKITDWSEVGGEPGEIRPFQRNSTSGSQTLFNKLVMQGEAAMEPEEELFAGTMGGLIEGVAAFDGTGSAIGFSVYYYADNMKSDPNLKMIAVEGVSPSNETISDGSYPLINDFYIALRASEASDSPARQLRDWMLSDNGKALLEEEGYVWARDGMKTQSRGAGNPF